MSIIDEAEADLNELEQVIADQAKHVAAILAENVQGKADRVRRLQAAYGCDDARAAEKAKMFAALPDGAFQAHLDYIADKRKSCEEARATVIATPILPAPAAEPPTKVKTLDLNDSARQSRVRADVADWMAANVFDLDPESGDPHATTCDDVTNQIVNFFAEAEAESGE